MPKDCIHSFPRGQYLICDIADSSDEQFPIPDGLNLGKNKKSKMIVCRGAKNCSCFEEPGQLSIDNDPFVTILPVTYEAAGRRRIPCAPHCD